MLKYDLALKSDGYLLLFHGSHEAAVNVEKLLSPSGPISLELYGAGVLAGQM